MCLSFLPVSENTGTRITEKPTPAFPLGGANHYSFVFIIVLLNTVTIIQLCYHHFNSFMEMNKQRKLSNVSENMKTATGQNEISTLLSTIILDVGAVNSSQNETSYELFSEFKQM